MSAFIEAVKHSGAKEALFRKIADLLWHAKYSLEKAAEHEDGRYKNFNAKVSEAKRIIAEAEELNSELIRMRKKP